MFLVIDNYDSFVYNLVRYFEELGEKILVVRNDKISIQKITKLEIEGIIISPGPKSPSDSGICLKVIEQFKGIIPIFGVCLGHQIIGQYFGANIIKGSKPMHGKISRVFHNDKGVFKNINNGFKVTRYHSLIIEKISLPKSLEITGISDDDVIMGIRHKEYCMEGVQFHPEAELTEFGHKLLSNFIREAREYNNGNLYRKIRSRS